MEIRGVAWLLIRDGRVLLERCPKKGLLFGGEWFVPGGKVERGETPGNALAREMREEMGLEPLSVEFLPVIDCAPQGKAPFFLQPYLLTQVHGDVPARTLDEGVELQWVTVEDALRSPVPQVRMMVAAASGA